MKITASTVRHGSQRAITLTEVLVYIVVFTVITGVATGAFFKFWDSARRLDRNADAIVRALRAGERWRSDIRHATGPIQSEVSDGESVISIPQGTLRIGYRSSHSGVWRRSAETDPWVCVLAQAVNSTMRPDAREHVQAWRWETELSTGKDVPRTKPRFTFLAVQGAIQ